jgi:hypothetical protein
MKFLTIARHKDSLYSLPPQKRAEVLTGTSAFIDKYLKAGKLKEIYFHGDMKGSVGIWEFQSSEEAGRLSLENPLLPFLDVSITPLIEYDVGKKLRMEALEQAAKK